MSANLREIKRHHRLCRTTHGDSQAERDFFIITSEWLVASHYYIGCWQPEVTALFALLWYFDKIHTLSSRPNYIKLKCQRFTYIDVLEVSSCLEVIYYMLLIQISIPRGTGTYDMPCSTVIRKGTPLQSFIENRGNLLPKDLFDLMIGTIYATSHVSFQVTTPFLNFCHILWGPMQEVTLNKWNIVSKIRKSMLPFSFIALP